MILADRESDDFAFRGRGRGAGRRRPTSRLFAKPNTLPNRRMGVALARGDDVDEAIAQRRSAAAAKVSIDYLA